MAAEPPPPPPSLTPSPTAPSHGRMKGGVKKRSTYTQEVDTRPGINIRLILAVVRGSVKDSEGKGTERGW